MTWPRVRVRIRVTTDEQFWLAMLAGATLDVVSLVFLGYGWLVTASTLATADAIALTLAFLVLEAERQTAASITAWARCRACEQLRPAEALTPSGVCKVWCVADEPREAA